MDRAEISACSGEREGTEEGDDAIALTLICNSTFGRMEGLMTEEPGVLSLAAALRRVKVVVTHQGERDARIYKMLNQTNDTRAIWPTINIISEEEQPSLLRVRGGLAICGIDMNVTEQSKKLDQWEEFAVDITD